MKSKLLSIKLQKQTAEAVIARMDELNSGMSENEIMPVLNTYLMDGVNKFLRHCPHKYLQPSELPKGKRTNGFIYIELPGDYLRLVELKCREWDMPVLETVSVEHPSFRYEKNKYLIKKSRPVVYEGAIESKNKLIFTQGNIEKAYYQKALKELPKSIPQDMKDDMAWFMAAELFIIFNEPHKAKIAYDRSNVFSFTGNIQGGQGAEPGQGEA